MQIETSQKCCHGPSKENFGKMTTCPRKTKILQLDKAGVMAQQLPKPKGRILYSIDPGGISAEPLNLLMRTNIDGPCFIF